MHPTFVHWMRQIAVSVLTLWLIGTALVIGAVVCGIAKDSWHNDTTALFRAQ